jgi:hypothetical protein
MKKRYIAIGLAVLAVMAVGLGWAYYVPIHLAREAVRLKLKDSRSLEFRNVRKVGLWVICGEVNTKNLGEYQEFIPFRVLDTNLMLQHRGFGAFSTSSAATMQVYVMRDSALLASDYERRLAEIENKAIKDDCESKKP